MKSNLKQKAFVTACATGITKPKCIDTPINEEWILMDVNYIVI